MADDGHRFWDTQPVPKINEETEQGVNEAIIPTYEDIRQTPYNLPKGFEWSEVDVTASEQLDEVYTLLAKNYVEDDDAMFRFDYSREFLQWALMPPGWLPQWHVGVRLSKSGKLYGFITAVPAHAVVRGTDVPAVEINFLCVHKKLRDKRLAPVLIQEITRRVHVEGIFQALYTAGKDLPRAVDSCRYYHRSLNPQKLVAVGFSYLRKGQTIKRLTRIYKVPKSPTIPNIRPMEEADVPAAAAILREYLADKVLYQKMSDEEFAHWLLPRDGIIYSYVVPGEEPGSVTDFVSFYCVPSTIINHPKYNTLKAAYLYYYTANSVDLEELVRNALIYAKRESFDVFNALSLMDNSSFLENLKFGAGDGTLQYYIYNWNTWQVTPQEQEEGKGIGLVLL